MITILKTHHMDQNEGNVCVMFSKEDSNTTNKMAELNLYILHVGEYKSRAHIREIQTLS